MSPPRAGTAPLLGLVALAVLLAFGPGAARVGAQTEGTAQDGAGAAGPADVLRIASVSPWVEPDGEFQVRFDPTSSVPPDASLTVTIHQSLPTEDTAELRADVQEVIDGGSAGRLLQAPVTRPFAELGDPAAGAALTIPIRSSRGESTRVLLPNPGIHPVELVLTRPDGPELWSSTVFLNRLPDSDEEDRQEPVAVSLVLPVGSEPAVATDGSASFDVEARTQLSSVASLLGEVPEAPLTLAVRPNTLDGLARAEEAWATDLLDQLSDDEGRDVVVQLPYAAVDPGALVASEARGELERQIVVGAGTVAARTARIPTSATFTADDLLTTGVLPVLAQTGVRSVLVPLESLALPDDVPVDRAITAPVELQGGEGIQGLAYDGVVSQRLADVGTDPAVRAHQSVALMMAGWFVADGRREELPLATAVLLAPSTDADVLASLSSTLRGGGPLVADPDAGPLPGGSADDPVVASLAPRSTPDLRAAVAATNETRRQISAYRSMTGEVDPDAELWDELTNESMAETVGRDERARLHASVRGAIATKVAQIHAPRSRRVVLTSDDTVIPLRFRNDLPYEVTLVMRVRSPRLDIDEPTREIVLEPGENRIDLPVTVQAPGESLLRIQLTSPDGGIGIPATDVPVRSTAISGVGAALSIISILFLFGWWLRTMRRRRRERARDDGDHPSAAPAEDRPAAPGPSEGGAAPGALAADRLGEGG